VPSRHASQERSGSERSRLYLPVHLALARRRRSEVDARLLD
jgi:hypothetical protein